MRNEKRSKTTGMGLLATAIMVGACTTDAALVDRSELGITDDRSVRPPAKNAPTTANAVTAATDGWSLVFSDEFDGTTLDGAKWVSYDGEQGNSKDTTNFAPENVLVEDGMARFKLEKRTVKGHPYAAGGMEALPATLQAYGRWDVRARFPAGKGHVGYIGLFGRVETEIDFGEVVGSAPTQNAFTQHWGPLEKDAQEQHIWTAKDSTADFHVYSVVWERGQLTWFVDGKEEYRTSQRFRTEPLLLAMGDWAVSCTVSPGECPNPSGDAPAYMDIDYVRIYQRGSAVAPAPDPAPKPAEAATWTRVYETVFGPNTPGHCGNAGCHDTTRAEFQCASKEDCYRGFSKLGLIDSANGTRSTLATEGSTPLGWLGGSMPPDGDGPQDEATALLRNWIATGAKND